MMRLIWILTTVLTLLSHVRTTDINHTLLPVISHGDIPVDCDPKFFEMTEKNLKESKSDEFYRGFIIEEAKKHPEDYTRLGEVSFFAHHAFNGLDVRCGSHLRGCSGIPTCREVLDHVQRHGGDKDKARKIYFSIKKIEFIVDTIFWFHRASAIIEHHASLVSEIILKEFAPKRHMVASDNCKAVKASFNAVASVTKTFETIVSSSPDNFSVASIFSLAMKLVDGFGAQGKDHVDNILLEKAIHDVIEFPELEGRKTAVEKLCDVEVKRVSADEKKTQHGKGPKPEELSHQSDILKKHVIRVTSSVRETVSNILSIIVSGNITARPGFSYLHELMSRNDWSENARRLYESLDEKRIIRIFEDSLMSSIWEDGKCYQKCVCKADGSAWNFCDTRGNNAAAKFRYCPDDCACQLQCLSSNMDGRKNEVELIGLEQLESWDVDFRDILIRSYHKYRENGPGLEKSDRSFDKLYKSHSELFELPTCVSYQLDMGDLKETGRHNNLFPCTCGDWRSNETQIFMRQLGFGMFQPGYKTDQVKELLTRDCPAVLTKARLKPFNRFLALCELGVRWPHHNDRKDSHGAIKGPEGHRVHHNMIDSHCRKLKKETEGMTEEEANFHFCIMSKTAQEVFDSELSHASGGGFLRPVVASMRTPDGGNHKHLCKQYLHY